MDIEDVIKKEFILTKNPSDLKSSTSPSRVFRLQAFFFLLSLALLFFLVYKIGFQSIVGIITRIGWGIVIIIALNGSRHMLRALSLHLALPPGDRTLKFRHTLAARLGGEVISFISFTGPILGDAAKVALLRRKIRVSQGGAAVVVDDVLYYSSVIVMILVGIGILSVSYRNSLKMSYVLSGIAAADILVFAVIIFIIWKHFKPLTWLFKKYSAWLPKLILKKKRSIYELENNIYSFYRDRRLTLFAMFGICFIAHFVSIFEVYFSLEMLGFSASMQVSLIIESLVKIINLVFSFVPGTIGFYEGGNGIILDILGFSTTAGVALAFVRRGAIIFWVLVGVLILLWRTIAYGTKHLDSDDSS